MARVPAARRNETLDERLQRRCLFSNGAAVSPAIEGRQPPDAHPDRLALTRVFSPAKEFGQGHDNGNDVDNRHPPEETQPSTLSDAVEHLGQNERGEDQPPENKHQMVKTVVH